ncbi:MAG TPA: hypothetical protein VGX23_18460 [Actinocrinis sp.]|nr:hypothetical protein [Actinocrinis sp.]
MTTRCRSCELKEQGLVRHIGVSDFAVVVSFHRADQVDPLIAAAGLELDYQDVTEIELGEQV